MYLKYYNYFINNNISFIINYYIIFNIINRKLNIKYIISIIIYNL